MGAGARIRRVSVEGLHGQFDVELAFRPGLNIIYGKNGTGKTTILHLLANALECDFRRFRFLQFERIFIESHSGSILEITKDGDSEYPVVTVEGSRFVLSDSNQTLSDTALSTFRSVFGGRPTYLPAFRSILERARGDHPARYQTRMDREDPDFKELLHRELAALKELKPERSSPWERQTTEDEAGATAVKSSLCRQWFGQFVPVIRYPSVAEVDESLSQEWQNAQIDLSFREQRMFGETFVKIFRTVARIESPPTGGDNEDLLQSIANLLKDEETEFWPSDIYGSLRTAVQATDSSATRGVDNSVLDIYRQVLERRKTERLSAFQRTRDFAASVNSFLENKKFTIGTREPTPRSRSVVSVVTKNGQSYSMAALSSGERQIVTMLYSASRTKFHSNVFLIDEPELSLHIDWQRIVLRELHNQAGDCQIIACTHSPEVGADHFDETQDFEPKPTKVRQALLFPEDGER